MDQGATPGITWGSSLTLPINPSQVAEVIFCKPSSGRAQWRCAGNSPGFSSYLALSAFSCTGGCDTKLHDGLSGLDHSVGHFWPLSITRQRHLLAYHGLQ